MECNSYAPVFYHASYEKKVLSRIIQNHEATFRYQVQELHQLYRRQQELMDEIRLRGIFMQHLQLQTSKSNHSLPQAWSDISQTSYTASWLLGDRPGSKLSTITEENILGPPTLAVDNFQECITLNPGPLLSYIGDKTPPFRSKGHEKRIMDLQLLADVCHDDEGGWFKEGIFSEAPEVTIHTPTMFPEFQHSTDSGLCSAKEGDMSSFNISSRKTNRLIDLNAPAPMQLESPTSSSTTVTHVCPIEINNLHVSVEAKQESSVPENCERVNCDGSIDGINSSLPIDLNSMPHSCLSETATTRLREKSDYHSGVLCSSKNELPLGSGIEILAVKYSPEGKDNENGEKAIVQDRSSAHDHAMRKENSVTGTKDKLLEVKTYLDLNTSVAVDEPFAPLPSTDIGIESAKKIDLEAPVSPDNKESSPPRDKFEDIELETPPLLSEQKEEESNTEIDFTTAKTLLAIFSSGVEEQFKAARTQPLGSFSNRLLWFAGIVSSIGDDLGEVIKLQNSATCNHYCKQSEENATHFSDALKEEKETGTFSSRKGQAKGTRQLKDFPTKVLASCGSISEDVQTVEWQLKTVPLKRNSSKNACAEVRKHCKLSPSDVKQSTMSILKRPASKQDILQGWGKTMKRQGGRRRP